MEDVKNIARYIIWGLLKTEISSDAVIDSPRIMRHIRSGALDCHKKGAERESSSVVPDHSG